MKDITQITQPSDKLPKKAVSETSSLQRAFAYVLYAKFLTSLLELSSV